MKKRRRKHNARVQIAPQKQPEEALPKLEKFLGKRSTIITFLSLVATVGSIVVAVMALQFSQNQLSIDVLPAIDLIMTTESTRDGYIGYWYDTVKPTTNDYKFVVSDGERDGAVHLKQLTIGNTGKALKDYSVEIIPYFKFIERLYDDTGKFKCAAYYFPIMERDNFFEVVYHPASSETLVEITDTAKSIACYNKLEHTSSDTIGFRTFSDDMFIFYREYCDCNPCFCYYCHCDSEHESCYCQMKFDEEEGEYLYVQDSKCFCYGEHVEYDEDKALYEIVDNLQMRVEDRLFEDSDDISDIDYYKRQTYGDFISPMYNEEDVNKTVEQPGIEEASLEYFVNIVYTDVLNKQYQSLYCVDTGYRGDGWGRAAVRAEKVDEDSPKSAIYERMHDWNFKAGYFIHNFPDILRTIEINGHTVISTSDVNYLLIEGRDLIEELKDYGSAEK